MKTMGDNVDKSTEDAIDSLQPSNTSSQRSGGTASSVASSSGDTSSVQSNASSRPPLPSNLRQAAREKRLSAFLEADRRAIDLQLTNRSIQEELEAQNIRLSAFREASRRSSDAGTIDRRMSDSSSIGIGQLPSELAMSNRSEDMELSNIAPRLTSFVGKAKMDFNSSLDELGLAEFDDEDSVSSDSVFLARATFYDARKRESVAASARSRDSGEVSARKRDSGTTSLPPEVGTALTTRGSYLVSLSQRMPSEKVAEDVDVERNAIGAASFEPPTTFASNKPARASSFQSKFKSGISPTPKRNLKMQMLGFLMLICSVVVFAILSASSSSSSPKSAPSVSSPEEVRATNRMKIPKSSLSLQDLSDDQLRNSFEALVGDDIHRGGSPQYMAAWWILEMDPLRHRSTLEQMEQRFLLACFYFASTNTCEVPWLSCNFELAFSMSSRITPRQTQLGDRTTMLGDRSIHQGLTSNETVSSAELCEFERPIYDDDGNTIGNEEIESLRWLSGYSECDWAGITCKRGESNDLNSLPMNSVVEINLVGQIPYETIVTEILQLPDLESVSY